MAEAEDVIVDAARHVTAYTMALWQRHRPPRPQAALTLDDIKRRLELLVEGAIGQALPVRTAARSAPVTLLSRLFSRAARRQAARPLPATDGASILLPAVADEVEGADTLDWYRITALHQALRCACGTAAAYPFTAPAIVQDLFLVREIGALDARLATMLPGYAPALAKIRAMALRVRPEPASLAEPMRSVERLYQETLLGSVGQTVPLTRRDGPHTSLDWARMQAQALAPGSARYAALPPDAVLGIVLRPDAIVSRAESAAHTGLDAQLPPRTATMVRRPRVREATPEEDDADSGPSMVQNTQPNEHVEDPMGLQRPVDQEPEADLDGLAESVSELKEARLVTAPGTPREILLAEHAPARAKASAAPAPDFQHDGTAWAFPEWDCTLNAYRERAAVVHIAPAEEGAARWVENVLARNRQTLQRVRRRFEALRARRSMERQQLDGDEIDIESFVASYGDARARLPRDDRVYLAHRPARRDFALLLLIDVSGSTDAWIAGRERIIDLEKEALIVVAEALNALGVDYAIEAFSGHGPANVRVRPIKRFEEQWGSQIAQRVAALEPEDYTRAGAALRHAVAMMMHRPAHRRLLLLLSDGKPNDCDAYEGRYGAEDFRQSLVEARLQGIAPFCVTVDRHAARHLPALFGPGNYTIVREPQHLTTALLDWLRSAAAVIR